ncbi:hypothetical protein ACA910_001011 [Epithemia clementina (nom. ined.)]
MTAPRSTIKKNNDNDIDLFRHRSFFSMKRRNFPRTHCDQNKNESTTARTVSQCPSFPATTIKPSTVRFAPEDQNLYIPNTWSKPQRRHLWYTRSELSHFKKQHSKASKMDHLALRKSHGISSKSIKAVRHVFNLGCCRYRNGSLIECYKESAELVGLEYQVLGTHGSIARACRRRALFEAIREIEMDNQGVPPLLVNKAEALRQSCERISRPATVFATHLAVAAAAAASMSAENEPTGKPATSTRSRAGVHKQR